MPFKKGNKSHWKGGIWIKSDGRTMIYMPSHPNATKRGYVYRYRLEMEQKIGRLLNKNEIVHHINGKCSDDRPENLDLMIQSKHASIHSKKHTQESIMKMSLIKKEWWRRQKEKSK